MGVKMSKNLLKQPQNELYALHLDGELLEGNVWKKFSTKYGTNGLYGWKPPKRIYYKLHHAKNGLSHLPIEIRNKVEIVKYIPASIATPCYPPSARRGQDE